MIKIKPKVSICTVKGSSRQREIGLKAWHVICIGRAESIHKPFKKLGHGTAVGTSDQTEGFRCSAFTNFTQFLGHK